MAPAVLFKGICRVHRAQVMQIRGAWTQAQEEAERVCADAADIHVGIVAEGCYQIGEIRRLRGDLEGAEDAYHQGHELGRDPEPGLALLRLAQRRTDAAAALIRSALAGVTDPLARARLLAAQVEIAVAAADAVTASAAADELDAVAAAYQSSGLQATAKRCRGAALLANELVEEALSTLRAACSGWTELEAPYDCAKARVLLARAYRQLGDIESSDREFDAARAAFEKLGAELDAKQAGAERRGTLLPNGLTAREADVLALVAAGSTNRDIADALLLSPKTVERHLSNIFTKLDVTTRTAAARYAFEHGIASPRHG
jgi:DNA-binding NarL/FixJ family response regulator